ncbi:MAG: HAD family hydrolase [Anaerolineales bacterium]
MVNAVEGPPIRAVIWDLGGVLVRTEDQAPRREWEARLGLAPRELARLVFEGDAGRRAAIGQTDGDGVWRWLGEHLRVPQADLLRLRDAFFSGDRVDEGLIDGIRSLRPRRRTALITNAWPDLRHWIEAEWAIGDAFDEILISAEEGVAKPHPEIYLRALRRLEVSSPQAVMIDDLEENLAAARALGMQTLRFESREQCAADLSRLLQEPFPLSAPRSSP